MARPGWVAPLFTFTTGPISVLATLAFLAVTFSTIFFYEGLPHVPRTSRQHGFNLDEAYKDLQTIAAGPHPYNSHQNDVVRSFLLDRLNGIKINHPNIRVEDDQASNVTFAKSQQGTYFEGNNLLVHIRGTSAMPAVLFSAHFDSVSTAPGATDDGMGVATLLQLVQHFVTDRPKRDVIFNINNAEEDGLLGALAFMAHPWAKEPTSFLNLEGAGGGGRALLFRTSSISVAKAFRSVPHPHGNVITENAFQYGSVRSDTDFTVYTKFGIPGLDLAFYKRRAIYHTKDDSVPSLAGKAALWNMLESAYFSGKSLAGDGNLDDQGVGDKAVYFDLFGEGVVVASLRTFFIIDIVLLVAGPILIATMLFFAYAKSKMYWSRKGWIRLPIAVVLGVAAPVALAFLINWSNRFIVYSSPYSVLAMQMSAAYVGLYLPLRLLAYYRPIFRQKTIVLFELYLITWVLMVLNTIAVSASKVGGLYAITFLHTGILFSLVLGLAEHFELPPSIKTRLVKRLRRDSEGREEEEGVTQEATERTPLLNREEAEVRDLGVDEENQYALWIFQLLLAAPFTMILFIQIILLVMGALQQTLADGNSSLSIYLGVGVLSFFTMFPLAPFAHKLHRSLLSIAVPVLLISTLLNIFAFPFTQHSPLKIYFRQTVDLDTGKNQVTLAGADPFLRNAILPELPSAFNNAVTCRGGSKFPELNECSWEGKLPSVASGSPRDWLKVKTSLIRPGYGSVKVRGIDTRVCKLYFNTTVKNVHVKGSSGEFLEHYTMPENGLTGLNLYSRTFNRTFEVEFGWEGDSHFQGRVGCAWDEKILGRIPAFDDIIGFLPTWATVSKYQAGLVEVTKSFTL